MKYNIILTSFLLPRQKAPEHRRCSPFASSSPIGWGRYLVGWRESEYIKGELFWNIVSTQLKYNITLSPLSLLPRKKSPEHRRCSPFASSSRHYDESTRKNNRRTQRVSAVADRGSTNYRGEGVITTRLRRQSACGASSRVRVA